MSPYRCQVSPNEQLSQLRAAHTLLQSGIRHIIWAEIAMGIAHCVPVACRDLQLLVSPYNITQAAHLICLEHPYRPIDVREAEYWPGEPKLFDPLTTVLLRHRDHTSCYHKNIPPHIYLHTASAFHFDIHDPTATTTNPNPPDESFKGLLYPSLIAFCNSIIDTIHEPPSPYYDFHFYWRWIGLLGDLFRYTVGEKGHTIKKRKLVKSAEWLLQEIKEENRPFLSRLLQGLSFLPLQTSALERILIKGTRCKREGIPFRCPVVPPCHVSDKFVPPKRELLRAIRRATALDPKATLWHFSPSSFRPLFRLASQRW